ncbi:MULTISPECIES: nucleotidyltransferase domain-containing protein [Cyanophyceae]|uniref:nucleotidyltransferase domain-containing protein n=1 Tax=Cyanophyceae TaxID=3028117 RepID=UPI00016DC694|nr:MULTISPECIES: nucleotidyltransferase domain-containing protein [Cyanophyceae]ACA98422.1 conserved hypothetical protein [Picosynechococcus sp. PCC 7002]SMH46713.1 hypothetical protein SAMN06272755_1701 [Picosynechococcus sp. OG1]SMQ80856.1 hypothetical protein SAMN06272774_0980 [Synechococcus sp. 7002]
MVENLQIVPSRGGFVIWNIKKIKDKFIFKNQYSPESKDKHLQKLNQQSRQTFQVKIIYKKNIQLDKIFSEYNQFENIDIYIHGSWVDETKTPFSDLDDLIIVKRSDIKTFREVRKIESWLNRVDMRFCRIDPLQHHGHWIIYKDQLENYDESYMPLIVLENSICLQGEKHISAQVDLEATQQGLEKNLDTTLSNIEKYYEKYQKGKINLFEMKCLVGSFLLIPAYVFQLQGKRATKKWAIENASNIYSANAHKALEVCSMMRQDWGKALNTFQFRLFSISPKFFTNPHLYRRFAQKMSPKFPYELFPTLEITSVQKFVQETRQNSNNG